MSVQFIPQLFSSESNWLEYKNSHFPFSESASHTIGDLKDHPLDPTSVEAYREYRRQGGRLDTLSVSTTQESTQHDIQEERSLVSDHEEVSPSSTEQSTDDISDLDGHSINPVSLESYREYLRQQGCLPLKHLSTKQSSHPLDSSSEDLRSAPREELPVDKQETQEENTLIERDMSSPSLEKSSALPQEDTSLCNYVPPQGPSLPSYPSRTHSLVELAEITLGLSPRNNPAFFPQRPSLSSSLLGFSHVANTADGSQFWVSKKNNNQGETVYHLLKVSPSEKRDNPICDFGRLSGQYLKLLFSEMEGLQLTDEGEIEASLFQETHPSLAAAPSVLQSKQLRTSLSTAPLPLQEHPIIEEIQEPDDAIESTRSTPQWSNPYLTIRFSSDQQPTRVEKKGVGNLFRRCLSALHPRALWQGIKEKLSSFFSPLMRCIQAWWQRCFISRSNIS